MIVGVDVHRRSHCAALIDERGVVPGTLSFANTAAGVRKLRAWLNGRDAEGAVVGIENGAGYGQLLCSSLAAAGHEVLNVPAWRTKRDRGKHGPGKSDPGDAVAIALRRALATVNISARRSCPNWYALWPSSRPCAGRRSRGAPMRSSACAPCGREFDPEAEVAVGNVLAARTLKRLRRLRLGTGVLGDAATSCFHCIVAEIARLDGVVHDLDKQLAELVAQSGNPLRGRLRRGSAGGGDADGASRATCAASATGRPTRAMAARRRSPCGSGATGGRHRLHRGGNRQVNAALHRIAIVQAQWDPAGQAYLERKLAEGKTPREARRALKRHLANLVYRRLHQWAEDTLPATSS